MFGERLYVLRSKSFGGFDNGAFPVMETVDFRSPLATAEARAGSHRRRRSGARQTDHRGDR